MNHLRIETPALRVAGSILGVGMMIVAVYWVPLTLVRGAPFTALALFALGFAGLGLVYLGRKSAEHSSEPDDSA